MVNISLDTSPIRADLEAPEQTPDTHFGDRSRRMITTSGLGNLAAMGEATPGDGIQRGLFDRKDAGLPTY